MTLSFAAGQTAGLASPGLRGRYSVDEGLARLLVGSGLYAQRQGNGGYVLVSVAPGDALELGATSITGNALGARTEGAGSYTSGSSNSATRLNLSIRETPQSISVVTRQRMDDEQLTSIETLLDRTPGISVQNIGTSRYGISSRGYSIDTIQLDGVLTALDLVSQNIPQTQADLVIYDRVEVLRGAAGLLTGAGDPSGTINLVRKKPTQAFQGYVGFSLGSRDRYRSEVDVSGPLGAATGLRGRFVGAHEQGGTHIDHYEQRKSVLYGVLEADLAETTLLTFGLDYQTSDPRGQSTSGLPLFHDTGAQTRFDPSDNAAARWNRNEIEAYNAFASLERKLARDWSLKLSANHLYGTREFSGAHASWGFPDQVTGSGVRLYGGLGEATQRQNGFDVNTQGPFELWGRRHELVLGFNWSEFENFHEPMRGAGIEGRYIDIYQWDNNTAGPTITGEKLMDYDGWQKQHGTYAALRLKPRDDLAIILGVRASGYQYRLSQIYTSPVLAANNRITEMKESGVVTPYAGVVYDIDDVHSMYFSYTSIFKPQSQRDRTGAVLDPREGDNYEAGLKSEFFGGRLNSAVALYQINQDNLAEADAGQTVPGTSPVQAAYRAVNGAKTRGVDVELSGELQAGWQIGASYNYSSTEDADGKRIRPTFPRQMVKLWTSYRLPGGWNRLTLGGGVNWQSGIHYTATTWQLPGIVLRGEQKAYAVANLMARYDINEQLSATFNLNNLFDKEYLQGLDTTFHTGIYAPTRNIMANLKYSF
ncbi:TonB-dependent siderophore receptor [Stutzerimonas kirkiae]|uniref:TonB-dependent siderophore receptor n=1 Tax=Stutzerimonas kirkiae TaxID=2211392 RepID=UPI001F60DF35|nr:TonB-dependent receptor [Stutzerimonas kirkiae]